MRKQIAKMEQLERRQLMSISYVGEPTSYGTNDNPVEVVTADVNHDSKLDVLTSSNVTNNIAVLLGDGAGHVGAVASTVSLPDYAVRMVVADINGDTHQDIVGSLWNSSNLFIALGNGDGTFGAAETVTMGSYGAADDFAVADVTGDGKLDLIGAATVGSGNGIVIRAYTGPGIQFADATLYATSDGRDGVWAADLNGDGRSDLITTGDSDAHVGVLLNNGNGFDAQVAYNTTYNTRFEEAVALDLNKDGKTDFATMTQGGTFDTFINQGNGTFVLTGSYTTLGGDGIGFADFNGDGNVDLMSMNDLYSDISILEGHGDGTFDAEKKEYFFYVWGTDAVAADMNNDGKIDWVMTDRKNDQVVIALNESTTSNPTPGDPTPEDPTPGDPTPEDPTPTTAPDLTATISGLPASVIGGSKGQANVVLQNVGDAKFGGNVTVTLYASADGTIDAGDAVLQTVTKTLSLKNGKTKKLVSKFDFPSLADGSYQIIAKVEGTGDTNAANDIVTASSPVTIAAPFVDLSTVISTVPAEVKLGKKLKTKFTLENHGNTDASGPVTLNVYAKANAEEILVGTLTKSLSIKTGKTKALTFTGNLPDTLTAGSYQLVVRTDCAYDSNPANGEVTSVSSFIVA